MMRAFASRVGLMKISINPGPGVPLKEHLMGGPHIPKEMSYEDLLDTNDVPLYQSPMKLRNGPTTKRVTTKFFHMS